MSGSKEKKTRTGLEGSFTDPRTAREAAERKKQKKSDRMYATIGIVFLLVAIVVVTWNSGIIQKNATALTINGESYNAAEVSYYYRGAYNSFLNQYGSYASMFGLDTSRPLQDQPCSFSSEGGSWYDYFMDEASKSMISVSALYDAAMADNFQVDDMDEQITEALESLTEATKSYNANYGTAYSDTQYLRMVYGAHMSMNIYKQQLQRQLLASAYSTAYSDSLTYSDSELSAAYAADTKAYDVVDYEQVTISGAAEGTTDADGNPVEATEAETAAAKEAAKTAADEMYSAFQAGQSLETLAEGNEKASYSDNTAGTYAESQVNDWLFDAARKEGDSTVIQYEGGDCYLLVFHSRYRHDYLTANVRHILVTPEATTLTEEDEGYAADVEAKKAVAKQTADSLLAEWKAGAATEDSFAALATEKTQDPGSTSTGGLYEQVYQGQMVETFNDWVFDASRKTGDSGIVETDYGYHVMYFVGSDVPYWMIQVEKTLKDAAYAEWISAKEEGYEATAGGFGSKFVA